MTQLCYTLEETAQRLSLSETVLVRLSQYFKVPRAAYEEVGYLSFKGDLAFTEQDIVFFRQVKERLLAGESLDEVKTRIREPRPEPIVTVPDTSRQSAAPASVSPMVAPVPPLGEMREIEDRASYDKAAEKSFERYKSRHRSTLGKVFENMLKEVGASADSARKKISQPGPKPLRDKEPDAVPERPGKPPVKKARPAARQDAVLPFRPARQDGVRAQTPQPAAKSRPDVSAAMPNLSGLWNKQPARQEEAWETIIKQAVERPRVLNNHLRSAAALVRDRALSQPQNHPDSQYFQ